MSSFARVKDRNLRRRSFQPIRGDARMLRWAERWNGRCHPLDRGNTADYPDSDAIAEDEKGNGSRCLPMRWKTLAVPTRRCCRTAEAEGSMHANAGSSICCLVQKKSDT